MDTASHCANHRAVGLGNHVWLTSRGQHPERLLVVRLQLLKRAANVSTWLLVPHWLRSQIHNAPARSAPPGRRPARSQSPSAPVPVGSNDLEGSLPIAAAKDER